MSFFEVIFTYEFMQNAVIAGILASIIASIIGMVVIEKKLVMLTGGVAHTAFGGVGLGYLVGFEPILGGGIFAVIASIVIGCLNKKSDKLTDVFIAVFWAVGMALGTVFISLSSGYAPDLSSYLFGNILTVTKLEVIILAVLAVLITATFIVNVKYVQGYLFDEEFLQVRKVNVRLIEVVTHILIALSVVVLIKITGIILVLALLAVPSATSIIISKRFVPRVIISAIIGVIYCFIGISLSYEVGLPTGATIIIISSVIYFIVSLISKIALKKAKKE